MQHILFLKGLTDVPSLVEEMREPAVTAQFDNSVGHAQGKQLGGARFMLLPHRLKVIRKGISKHAVLE